VEEEARILREKLLPAQRRTFRAFVNSLAIRVVECCHDQNVDLNDALRAEVADAIRGALLNQMEPGPFTVALPPGCHGALACLSERLYVVVISADITSEQRKVLAHELIHVADRLTLQDAKIPIQVCTEKYQ
jgi:hypothetical protein